MKKQLLTTLLCSTAIFSTLMINQTNASAHGFVESPPSRGYQGRLDRDTIGYNAAFAKYGNVITNHQSLEARKGFPQAGPADGRIASAEGGLGQINDFVLDNQTSSRWTKQEVTQGPMNIVWNYTAPHSTAKWHYYITKADWNPDAPLARDSFELISTIDHDASPATNNPNQLINIPNDRLGYHVVLAVWDIADTANAFYNVIDVNVKGSTGLPVAPTAPQNVRTTNVTASSVSLAWNGQANTASYNIYRDGVLVGNSVNASFEDKNLNEETTYRYEIEAVGQGGLTSNKTAISVTTTAQASEEKPTAPQNLHSMGTTSSSVSLMWGRSSHTQGIKQYDIYRDGKKIASTSNATYNDTNLSANTTYSYTVKAISNSNEVSDFSNTLRITTAEKSEGETEVEGRQWQLGSFFAPQTYTENEVVVHQGKRYTTLQTHVNYGDSTWAPDQAASLFRVIK